MSYVQVAPVPVRPAPAAARRSIARALVGGVAYLLTTLAITAFAWKALPHLMAWAFTHATWSGDGERCRTAGACWSFLHAKMPFILFGIYPDAERWRPMVVIALLLGLAAWTMPRARWTPGTLVGWICGILLSLALMAGGMAGLSPVPTADWGGLPITLLLTILSLAFGFPLGLGLALGRRSHLPALRWVATAFVEIVRGLPLLTLLFVASLMAPLLLPAGLTLDQLLRALFVFTLSAAAYIAEVLRGGFQGVSQGQEKAAFALGLRRRDILLLITLPQAIRYVLPPLTNTVIVIIKNTSLVLVVGLFDLLSAGRVVLSDPAWPTPYVETYLFIGLIYFGICYGIARYGLYLERTLGELRQ